MSGMSTGLGKVFVTENEVRIDDLFVLALLKIKAPDEFEKEMRPRAQKNAEWLVVDENQNLVISQRSVEEVPNEEIVPYFIERVENFFCKESGVPLAEFRSIMGRDFIFGRKGNESEFQRNFDYARHMALALSLGQFIEGDDQDSMKVFRRCISRKFHVQEMRLHFENQRRAVGKITDCLNNQASKLELGDWGSASAKLYAVPPHIGVLKDLDTLSFSCNKLTLLPDEIWQLKKLKSLDLSANWFTSLSPQIVQLPQLTHLKLESNMMKLLPADIGKLTSLKELWLNDNHLAALPPEIGQLANLTLLSLRENQLTILPPEIGKLKKLARLDVCRNQLTALPSEMGNLENLVWLKLNRNQLTALPPDMWKLEKLTELYLSGNQFTVLPPMVGRLVKLTQLSLDYNQLTDLPLEMENLVELRWFNINNNPLINTKKLEKLCEFLKNKEPKCNVWSPKWNV